MTLRAQVSVLDDTFTICFVISRFAALTAASSAQTYMQWLIRSLGVCEQTQNREE